LSFDCVILKHLLNYTIKDKIMSQIISKLHKLKLLLSLNTIITQYTDKSNNNNKKG